MKDCETKKKELVSWLMDSNELGKEPWAIKFTKEFTDEDGTCCVIFKFKKSMLSPWMLAINSDAGCFSRMEKYNRSTEVEDAKKIIKFLHQYRQNLLNDCNDRKEREEKKSNFLASILLNTTSFSFENFESAFKEEWGMDLRAFEKSDDEDGVNDKISGSSSDAKIYVVDGSMIVLGFLDIKVPNGEAEDWAQFNYMWPDAVEVTSTHKAHVFVLVLGEGSFKDRAVLYTKVVSAFCKLDITLGVYANKVVYSPDFFYKASMMIKDEEFPIFNTVWFGIGKETEGVSGWTCGLDCFGKDEIEIISSEKHPMEIREVLFGIARYVIEEDVILHDGETIGLTAEQRLKITRSEGINVSGMSLKIEY